MTLAVGEVKVPDEAVFENAIKLFKDTSSNWELRYNKNKMTVHTKSTSYSNFKIIKICSTYPHSAATIYDVIHDEEYRRLWDTNMLDGFQITRVSDQSDITYYALKSPFMFKNRDFVTQRCWRVRDGEYFIFNHSIFHKNYPEKKGFVRGVSYVTGYLIKHISDYECSFIYLAQGDPRGHIPSWAINKFAKLVAPRVSRRLDEAAKKYTAWKMAHRPDFKPWLNPSQCKLPIFQREDILNDANYDESLVIDESAALPPDNEGDSDSAPVAPM